MLRSNWDWTQLVHSRFDSRTLKPKIRGRIDSNKSNKTLFDEEFFVKCVKTPIARSVRMKCLKWHDVSGRQYLKSHPSVLQGPTVHSCTCNGFQWENQLYHQEYKIISTVSFCYHLAEGIKEVLRCFPRPFPPWKIMRGLITQDRMGWEVMGWIACNNKAHKETDKGGRGGVRREWE